MNIAETLIYDLEFKVMILSIFIRYFQHWTLTDYSPIIFKLLSGFLFKSSDPSFKNHVFCWLPLIVNVRFMAEYTSITLTSMDLVSIVGFVTIVFQLEEVE